MEIIDTLAKLLNSEVFNILSKKNEDMLRHFAKSIAITLGRLGQIDPQGTAYCLPKIIKPWCIALRYISGSDEKIQAF
jgi:hypothetical protein